MRLVLIEAIIRREAGKAVIKPLVSGYHKNSYLISNPNNLMQEAILNKSSP